MKQRSPFLFLYATLMLVVTCVAARELATGHGGDGYVVSELVSSRLTGDAVVNGNVISRPKPPSYNSELVSSRLTGDAVVNGNVISRPKPPSYNSELVSSRLTGDAVVNGNVISRPKPPSYNSELVSSRLTGDAVVNGNVISRPKPPSYTSSNSYMVSQSVSYTGTKPRLTGPGNGGGNV